MTEPKKAPAKKRGRPRKKPIEASVLEGAPEPIAEVISRPPDGISVSKDLDEEQREMFAQILKSKMTLEERANALVALAKMTDTKRAPVGLRAIQEINAITGVHKDKPNESQSMFVFPEDTTVSIHVEKVYK